MKTTKIQKIYTGVFIFTAGMAFCTQAALAPENILLDDTLMVITCRDLNKSKSYITEGTTPLGMLLKDPAMQPFCNAIKEQIGTFKSELTKALDGKDIKWEDFQNNLFKGGISLSITGFQSIQKDSSDADSLLESFFFQPLIMAEFNSDNQKIKELFDKVEFTYGTENVADTEFISVNLNEKGTLWMGVKDSILYVTHSMNEGDDRKLSLENLTKIIDKPSDRSTLAQTERFKEQENITPETDYLWVNLEMITESVKEFVLLKDKEYVAPEAGSMEALVANARPLAIYNALGISAFKSFSISSQIENGEGFSTMSVACPSTERRGISALIDIYKKLDCTPAAFIPANIISYSIAQIVWQINDWKLDGLFFGVIAPCIRKEVPKRQGNPEWLLKKIKIHRIKLQILHILEVIGKKIRFLLLVFAVLFIVIWLLEKNHDIIKFTRAVRDCIIVV